MDRHPSVKTRVGNFKKWFNRENERPLFGFFLESQYPLHRYSNSLWDIESGLIGPDMIVPERFLNDFRRLHKIHEEAGGDLLWSAAPFFGLPWVEASLGCGVIADKKAGSTHTLPPKEFLENPEVPPFSSENPWIKKLLHFITILKSSFGDTIPIGTTLMRGISDLLAALYGNDRFLFRMIEEPEEITRVIEGLTEYWIAFGKFLMEHIPLCHGGTGSFFYSVWCPGKTIWMQEDTVALLSPELYEAFILPANIKMADSFEHSVMHLHPAQFIPVSYLLHTSVDVLELHIDLGGPKAEDLLEIHKSILRKKPLIIWGDISETDINTILENLSSQGLIINVVVKSISEADHYWKIYNKFY